MQSRKERPSEREEKRRRRAEGAQAHGMEPGAGQRKRAAPLGMGPIMPAGRARQTGLEAMAAKEAELQAAAPGRGQPAIAGANDRDNGPWPDGEPSSDQDAAQAQRDAIALTGTLQAPETGRAGPIGRDQVAKAEQTLKEYKRGKATLEARIVENEQWYKLRHWDQIRQGGKAEEPEPTSAWLLNSLANKHADAMDNFPEPNVLPREADDEQDAKLLSSILPVVLEQNDYEQAYSDMWWYKLKTGTGVMGVFWDTRANGGLGDIAVRNLDMLNLYWEPGVTDIQASRNLFHTELMDRDLLEEEYPFLKGRLASPTIDAKQYVYDDTVDVSKKVMVVDWYYKVIQHGVSRLHYCKFAGGEVLYASENDPVYAERGFYDHGKYPFILDTLFPVAGSPAGFGYLDICKSPQLYIDKLDQAILKRTMMEARPRFFVRGDGSVNEEEYADWSRPFVHWQGSGDPRESVMPLELPGLSQAAVTVRSLKVEELKETSGNRDFSQGGTVSGVTAASAIAALQEAGSKLSRDMLKSSYRAFAQVNYLCVELIRQFYQEDRWFRVVGETGRYEYLRFSGRRIAQKPQGSDFGLDMGYRVPVFDIQVTSQKSSPFSTAVQNERAKELYGMGFFKPDLADQALAALDMMQFEGVEKVRERISQNQTLYQQVLQLQQQMLKMAAIIDRMGGTNLTQSMAPEMVRQARQPSPGETDGGPAQANPLGDAMDASGAGARVKAARNATPE